MRALVRRARRLLLAEGGLPLVWIVLTALVLVPVWHQRVLPMLDTPNHLALARGWHNFHDPSWNISQFYELRLRAVLYMLFYVFIHLAMYVVPIEIANKLFLSLYLILFPLSVLSVARALKRSPWLALGAFALAFNQNWIYGFSSYLMGTAFFFFAIALLINYLRDDGRWRAWLLGVLCVMMYFAHVLPWFTFGLCAIALLALNWDKGLRVMWAAAAMLPSLILALLAVVNDRAERAYMKTGESLTASWRDFPTDVKEFPRRVMELFPGKLDYVVLSVIALTVVGLALWYGVGKSHEQRETRWLKWILIVLGITYLSLPYNVSKPLSWWYISPRLPSLIAPLLLLVPLVVVEGRKRLLFVPLIVACVVLPLKLARLYRDFSNRNAAFMRLVEEVPRGKSCFVAYRGMMRGSGSEEKSGDPATSAPVYWHWTSWPMALRGGFGPHVFDQGVPIRPVNPLMAPPYNQADMFDIRLAPEFDYYLVRTPLETMEREPSIKQVDALGEWVLYRRIGPLTEEP
jgi:hypothetical protein